MMRRLLIALAILAVLLFAALVVFLAALPGLVDTASPGGYRLAWWIPPRLVDDAAWPGG